MRQEDSTHGGAPGSGQIHKHLNMLHLDGRARLVLLALLAGAILSMVPFAATGAPPPPSSASIDQCTNGPVAGLPASKQPCVGSNAAGVTVGGTSYKNWGTGNSNASKSHWKEGDFISYRTVIVVPPGAHFLEFHWDTVNSSKHAIDYVGSWDATETTSLTQSQFNYNNNNPCA